MQLGEFIEAELYLINNAERRELATLLTSTFLMNQSFGKKVRGGFHPYQGFLDWLKAARQDGQIDYPDSFICARMFYGLVEGCLTWPALMSEGASLAQKDILKHEIISIFLRSYGVEHRKKLIANQFV